MIGGAHFRFRIFSKLDCHHMFKSVLCNLREVRDKIEKINNFKHPWWRGNVARP